MVTKLVSRALAVLPKLKEVFKNDKDRSDTLSEYAQFFIERFNESIKISEKQVETEVILQTLDNVRAISELQK
jgi:mannose/fructose/N-acetylgalactosamine-specific phosphotransferase system component IID